MSVLCNVVMRQDGFIVVREHPWVQCALPRDERGYQIPVEVVERGACNDFVVIGRLGVFLDKAVILGEYGRRLSLR